MKIVPYFGLVMTAMLSSAAASTILDTVDPQFYRDEAALYPSVGKVTGSGLSGSGVLLSDRWVLTAGHVADFKAGGTYSIGGLNYTIESSVSHPSHGILSTSFDVGLLYLSAPVMGIEIATMWRTGDSSSLLGREATWVGNGITGTGLDTNRGPNEMRAFTNIIDGLTPAFGLPAPSFYSDFDNPDGSSNSLSGAGSSAIVTRLEGNVTAGDSGGGVFVDIGGSPYLVGIGSYTGGFTQGLNSRYGALSGAADLNYFHDWIFSQTGIAAVPEPSLAWLACIGGLLTLRRRR